LPEELAPGLQQLGLFLPYTPLHATLLRDVGRPLVMTSGNVADDPIAYTEEDARRELQSLADAYLHHNRPIARRCEDSVCSIIAGRPAVVRRARGYAPAPIAVTRRGAQSIMAVGGHLKNTFCFLKDRTALVGPHVGDLHHFAAYEQFRRDIEDAARLLDFRPELVAHDLHPDYLSTKYAVELRDLPKVAVQHHHAHIASCLAENGTEGPVIGVAFDGLGMGYEGELWGGEFLIADALDFTRAAAVQPVLLPGGERAVREAWRIAAACLWQLGGAALLAEVGSELFSGHDVGALTHLMEQKVNCPPCTSAGRLFDGVAALSGVCLTSAYESDAAMRLESSYNAATPGPDYRMPIVGTGPPYQISWSELVFEVLRDRRRGATASMMATRFHRGFALAARNTCLRLRDDYGLNDVALSGGVFHNKVFTELLAGLLQADGFTVLLQRDVPPGDGGLSLGQAMVADRKAELNR
jgi:hydrogenase maturation protein HypF